MLFVLLLREFSVLRNKSKFKEKKSKKKAEISELNLIRMNIDLLKRQDFQCEVFGLSGPDLRAVNNCLQNKKKKLHLKFLNDINAAFYFISFVSMFLLSNIQLTRPNSAFTMMNFFKKSWFKP